MNVMNCCYVPVGDDRYFTSRPDEQLHLGYHGDSSSPRKPYPPYASQPLSDYYNRSSIDPYATLTPSERMRYQGTEAGRHSFLYSLHGFQGYYSEPLPTLARLKEQF